MKQGLAGNFFAPNLKAMRIFCCILLMFLMTPFAAKAAERGYDATYDVYAGGVHALQARLTYRENGDRYRVNVASETYGLLGKLVPWKGNFATSGWNVKGGRQPEKHHSSSLFKGEMDEKIFAYAKNGKFLSYKKIEGGKEKPPSKDVDLGIAEGATDILSATLETLDQLARGDSCAHADKIFDGERTFQMNFEPKGTENLSKSKNNLYAGPSVTCAVEVVPDQGKWHKKPRGWLSIQEQGRKKGALPTLWFAPVAKGKNQPAVPVKILLKTDYGTFVIHLTSFTEKGAE